MAELLVDAPKKAQVLMLKDLQKTIELIMLELALAPADVSQLSYGEPSRRRELGVELAAIAAGIAGSFAATDDEVYAHIRNDFREALKERELEGKPPTEVIPFPAQVKEEEEEEPPRGLCGGVPGLAMVQGSPGTPF